MSSDEARAEAERRMHEQRESVGLMVVEQARFVEGFVQGAEWQADHDHMLDAVRALVEQQRIATLIALATLTDVDTDGDILRADAMDRLVQWVPHGPDDEHPEVRPEIAAALGIKTKETNE